MKIIAITSLRGYLIVLAREGIATRAIHGVNATGNACLRLHCKSALPPVKLARHNLTIERGDDLNPLSPLPPKAVQSNEVYLPQEAIDDLRKLGPAADKR